MGCVGMGCVGTGCDGCIGGRPGLRVCPGVFKTTIMLMTVRDSSVRIFLLFIIFFRLVVCVWLPSTCSGVWHFGSYYGPGRSFAMGCNPTVDYGRTPPAENGPSRELYFVARSEFLFSLAMPSPRTRNIVARIKGEPLLPQTLADFSVCRGSKFFTACTMPVAVARASNTPEPSS